MAMIFKFPFNGKARGQIETGKPNVFDRRLKIIFKLFNEIKILLNKNFFSLSRVAEVHKILQNFHYIDMRLRQKLEAKFRKLLTCELN